MPHLLLVLIAPVQGIRSRQWRVTMGERTRAEHLASLACKNPPPGCTCGGCWLAKKRAELAVKGEDDE